MLGVQLLTGHIGEISFVSLTIHSLWLSAFSVMPLEICSALALLMARIGADHHDAAVTTNHAAILADSLHTRADLHGFPLLVPTCNGT